MFVTLLPAIKKSPDQKERSVLAWGREEKKKKKERKSFEGSLPIQQIDWYENQRRVLSARLKSEVVKC